MVGSIAVGKLIPGLILVNPEIEFCGVKYVLSLLITALNLLLTVTLPTMCAILLESVTVFPLIVVMAVPGGILGPMATHVLPDQTLNKLLLVSHQKSPTTGCTGGFVPVWLLEITFQTVPWKTLKCLFTVSHHN